LIDTVPCRYVVGVAEDIHSQSIEPESKLYFYYMPAAQWQPQVGGLFVRSSNAKQLAEPLRKRLQQEMPGASYVTVGRLGDFVDAQMRPWVIGATLFTAFGALALILAAVGLYSVIAYNVTQRTHEMGVRVALGAQPRDVIRLIVNEGLRIVLPGVALGAVLALVAGRWIAPLLFQVSPKDPPVLVGVVTILVAVATVASWLPARRAARVDPNEALRAD
jgi:ABC-type antimicrobial peptide transport system permease subunit